MVMMRECDTSTESDEVFNASFIPSEDNAFDIGSSDRQVHDFFVGGTIFMNGAVGEGILLGAASLDADTGTFQRLNIVGVGSTTDGARLFSTGVNAGALEFSGYKTRAVTTDANTIVVSGDELLGFTGYGADGAAYQPAAQILLLVDGTPGAGDMPGAVAFLTSTDGAATLLERWRIKNDGTLTQNTTNGSNIVITKALTGVANQIATLAGAGSTQADAAAVASTVARVTGANGTVGVKLPALASVPVGFEITIINSDVTNLLKVYSNAVGELITGQAGTTAISVAAKLMLRVWKFDATNWYAEKGVTPY